MLCTYIGGGQVSSKLYQCQKWGKINYIGPTVVYIQIF